MINLISRLRGHLIESPKGTRPATAEWYDIRDDIQEAINMLETLGYQSLQRTGTANRDGVKVPVLVYPNGDGVELPPAAMIEDPVGCCLELERWHKAWADEADSS